MLPSVLDHIHQHYFEPRKVSNLPVTLMTATVDRWEIGRHCGSGPHEGRMAMWAIPFYGGMRLAAHIFKNPDEFRGKKLVDIGSGSGLVAIAAAMAGAEVTAIDSSFLATEAIRVNAALNNVALQIVENDALTIARDEPEIYRNADIVTAADVFYLSKNTQALIGLLSGLAKQGKYIYATSQDEELGKLMVKEDILPDILGPSVKTGRIHFVRFSRQNMITRPLRQYGPQTYGQRLQERMRQKRLAARLASAEPK